MIISNLVKNFVLHISIYQISHVKNLSAIYTNDYAFLFVHELVEPKTTVICLMQNVVYESVVTKAAVTRTRCRRNLLAICFYLLLRREEEKNEKKLYVTRILHKQKYS